MFYTVIQRSGWNTDQWTTDQTFTREADAREWANKHQQPDPRQSFYSTAIKAHKKKLEELTNFDNFVTTFSDGTKAVYSLYK